ncbi:MAG: CPBP family intramembrane glutamic endopeptidase, partial [Acidobacteriota bacterium]
PLQAVTEPSPNSPPWGIWVALGVWVASVLAIIVFPGLFLLPYAASLNGQFASQEELFEFLKNDPKSLFLQVIAVIPAHVVTLIAAWFVVTRARRFSFRKVLGWEMGGFKWWYFAVILGGFFGIAGITGYFVPETENEFLRILKSSRDAVIAIAFLATFTAPLVEEVVYRGLLYSAFQSRFGANTGVLTVTALFAAVHVPQYYPSFSTIFLLVLLSLTLTMVRVISNNLLPCVILHMLFNGIQSVLLILEPYLPKTSQATTETAAFFFGLK